MKNATSKAPEQEMQREYDFSHGVRGKYARRYAEGSNIVVLDPDLAKVFPTTDAVNKALRALAGIISTQKETLQAKQ